MPVRHPSPYAVSRTVSRVLYLTAIYLGAPLPVRSSHLLGTAGQASCPSTVLLRIEFTAASGLPSPSELLPHFSTLTTPPQAPHSLPAVSAAQALRCPPLTAKNMEPAVMWRYLSVALVLGSPPAGVTRYPCPVEPGLSSDRTFRCRPAAVCSTHKRYFTKTAEDCQGQLPFLRVWHIIYEIPI